MEIVTLPEREQQILRESINELVRLSEIIIFKHGYSIWQTAGDVLSDAVLRMHVSKKPQNFSTQKEFLSLAYTVMKNVCLNYHRIEGRNVELSTNEYRLEAEQDDNSYYIYKDRMASLAVENLPAPNQEILYMRGLGIPHIEIAKRLNITHAVCRQAQHYNMKTLKLLANE